MTSRDGKGAILAISLYERSRTWTEGRRALLADVFPAITPRNVLKPPGAAIDRVHARRTDCPETERRRRAPRPRSHSRTRTGGAAGAAVLIMLGAGTLGAFPGVHVLGRAANTAAGGSTPSLVTNPEAEALAAVGAGPGTGLVADQTSLEQRPAEFTTALPDQRAQVAIRTAMAQIGLPYVWGGDGPTNGDVGFDCSGLTTFAYAAAGVRLPRTAHTQYYTGPHVLQGAALQPGDLVFYGTPAKVHHVGMYLGEGKMVNAPTFDKPVQVAFYRWNGDDYLGATRPAASGRLTEGLLPYAPAEPSTGTPEIFPAPPAPAPTATPQPTLPQPAEAVSAAQASSAAGAPLPTTETTPKVPTPTTAAPTTATDTSTATATTSSAAAVVTTTTSSTPSTATTTTKADATTTTPLPSSATSPTSRTRNDTVAVTLPGGAASLPTVTASAGVPTAVGVAAVSGTTVLRVPVEMLGAVGDGSRITVAGTAHLVTSLATAATAEVGDLVAAAPAGAVVVLAPAVAGEWTVVTAA